MKKSRKLIVFLLLSLVSLFADMTYEGARSVGGAYLEVLSAPVIFSGLLGIGELISYASRALTGGIISKYRGSRSIWFTVFIGYILNLAVVPALAFTGNWELAFTLMLLERVGKGLRNPSRDVILSEVVDVVGRGRGFGLHEFFDQLGAISGPLIIAYYISHQGYASGFKFLAIPATISILLIATSFALYPKISSESVPKKVTLKSIPSGLKDVIILFSLFSASLMPWGIVSYHIAKFGLGGEVASLLYAVAMVTDAIGALLLGFLYDKVKLGLYVILPPISFASTYLLIGGSGWTYAYLLGAALWGIIMGYFESVFRATISELSGGDYAGGFGTYAIAQAISFGIGSVIYAVSYTLHPSVAIIYSLIANIASAIYLLKLKYAPSPSSA